MTTRILTGVGLVALLAFAVYMGGWVFSVLFMASLVLAIYEVYRALTKAGNRPVQWPTWVCMAASIPLFVLTKDTTVLMLLIFSACLLICTNVMFRGKPKLEDLLSSCLPLFSVLLPGMCMLGFLRAQTRLLQSMLILLSFGIPLMGDTMAYFVGSRYGTKRLCPAVSPNKSVEGAVAGLLGSILFSVVCGLIFGIFGAVPPLWHFLILGLAGGFAGQIGDLFASLIKRHCGIKDFGTIFPGHGGMMDRLDSVFFSTVVIYIYYCWMV